jgi:ankyrin repeat protein
MLAAAGGPRETVRILLDQGANPNAKTASGATALLLATNDEREAVVPILLERGASANAADDTGVTPLMMAAEAGSLEAVKALLAHGANPWAMDGSGGTALKRATDWDQDEIAQLLKQAQAAEEAPAAR